MDCQKLYKDIERLKSLRDELKDKYDASVESGLGKTALQKVSEQASANADEVLEEYLDVFFEHNPDITKWQVGNLIPGFEGDINSLTTLPDGSVMAGGDYGALYNITKDQSGDWQVGNLIPGFKGNINSLTTLPDGSVMAGGDDGALYNMTKDQDGNWRLGDLIPGFRDAYGDIERINSLTSLPDGSVMAGGDNGALRNIIKDPDGNWKVGILIPGFEGGINSLTTLPDGSVMAGGDNGALRNISRHSEPTLETLKNSLQKITKKK